jgi:H2-forming N5,N10-methylenetetrahydromethanopterin dehydrogenase-like enzyme
MLRNSSSTSGRHELYMPVLVGSMGHSTRIQRSVLAHVDAVAVVSNACIVCGACKGKGMRGRLVV